MENTITEKVFYKDENVLVTEKRVVALGQTFVVQNISSATVYGIRKSTAVPVVLAILGGIGFLQTFGKESSFNFIPSLVLLLGGTFWILLNKDNEFAVRINSGSNNTNTFKSKDKALIAKIVSAINEAMIYQSK